MSRGRRRSRQAGGALSSMEQTASDIYKPELPADIVQLDNQRRPAKPVDIFDIFPDRSQPRRTVPSRVRHIWDGRPETVKTLFQGWLTEIRESGWPDFDPEAYLNQNFLPEGVEGNTEEAAEQTRFMDDFGPLEQSFLTLIDLAVSIRKIGLTNPITVAKADRVYHLETGERRWLAYHLLHLYFPDEDWSKIPAQIVDEVSVWRQASENNARENLNAISRARQLAILLMDMLEGRGYEFYSLDEVLESGGSEREYYAQVADGDEFRVPRGEGERLMNAMGLKNPTQIRQYRRLLRLSDDLWHTADDKNLTEGEVRKILNRNTSYGIADRDTETSAVNPFVERINKRRRSQIWNYANRLEMLNEKERRKALNAIEEDERWLSELKRALASRD